MRMYGEYVCLGDFRNMEISETQAMELAKLAPDPGYILMDAWGWLNKGWIRLPGDLLVYKHDFKYYLVSDPRQQAR